MAKTSILYEKRDDRIAVVTINRPEALNALTREMYEELEQTWRGIMKDDEVSVVVLTGAGDRAFCAGADLKQMASGDLRLGNPIAKNAPPLLEDWEIDFWKPIVCAVNGYALGQGLSLVMATDVRVASEKALFGMSQVKWGIASGTGTQILPRMLPYAIGMEMLLTGENVTAQRALEVGLVNYVTPADQLMDKAMEIATIMAGYAPIALQTCKEAAVKGLHFNLEDALRWGFKMEKLNSFTEDAQEGPKAFAERRPPVWKGR